MNRLICRTTGEAYPLNAQRWRSERGGLLDIEHTQMFDPAALRERSCDLWRYREAIALAEGAQPVSFGEGFTPLLPYRLEGREVWLKLDFLFPSGSYKDRGAAVLMTQARALGVRKVVQDSSGNAGCAVAAYAARADIACEIYVPADTSAAKLAQIRMYGATLQRVPGSREATAEAALAAAEHTYYASHVWNPFFLQGTKTFAYEICEQLGWEAPDAVVLPAGNGTLLLGAWLGFTELHRAGIIGHLPRLLGIQAQACAPLLQAFSRGESAPEDYRGAPTLAEGIAIARPARAQQMLACVKESGGMFLGVEEQEITESLHHLAGMGHYVEPTSAAVIAGLRRYLRDHASSGERIVSVLTGTGLKATEKMLKLLEQA